MLPYVGFFSQLIEKSFGRHYVLVVIVYFSLFLASKYHLTLFNIGRASELKRFWFFW